MEMGVVVQILSPAMQDGYDAEFGAEMLGVRADDAQRLGGGPEQDVVDDLLVLEGDLGDLRGKGEDHVEILGRQQIGPPVFQPRGAGQALTLRAMAVAAAVIGRPCEAAVLALLEMTAQNRRPAGRYGAHDLGLDPSEAAFVIFPVGRAVAAEHVRHLQRPKHDAPRLKGAAPPLTATGREG